MMRFTLLMFALLLGLSACSKEEPNPEERDPIYKDLEKRAADYQKSVDEAQAKVKELSEALDKAKPNTIEEKDIERDLHKYRAQLVGSQQLALYYKIRTDRRKYVDHVTYHEAFVAKKSWPDKNEYSDYLVNMRLNEVNLNWNARVPKLQDRVVSSKSKSEQPKKGEGGE